MADKEQPLFDELRHDLTSLAAELREMAAARWELARLELLSQRNRLSGLIVVCVAAAVMALTALPLLAWCLADSLDGWCNVPRAGWLVGFSVGLLLAAALSSYCAVRRFRRHVTGLQETLEELREDTLWLREWIGSRPQHAQSEAERQRPDGMP
jgi:uncharacterized membrane protein YqjE